MQKCIVIMNPSSGKEKAADYKEAIIKQLHNYDVTVKETSGEGDAKLFAKEACDEKVDVVVLVGGDGTLNEGINGIAEQPHRPIVGIVPLGTVNDFARALNISLNPEEAIAQLGNETAYADIGKVNHHYFTNVIAIGSLAQAVGDVSVEQKTKMGSFAYLLEGVKALVGNDSFSLTVETDEEKFSEEAILFICVLTNTVGSFTQINEDADITDGLLHGFIVKSGSLVNVLSTAKNLLSGNAEEDDQIVKFDAKEMQVSTDKKLGLNIDGDMLTDTPATISILPRHIQFFV